MKKNIKQNTNLTKWLKKKKLIKFFLEKWQRMFNSGLVTSPKSLNNKIVSFSQNFYLIKY